MSDEAFKAWREAFEMERELLATREWALTTRIELFGRSVRLLENNGHEFWLAVHYLTKDNRSHLLDDKELKRWLEEVDRRLHNVVAAVHTVIDHTRVLSEELYGLGGISPEYNERKTRLGNTPVVRFVKELRQFFQHWRLPAVVHIESSSAGKLSRKIALKRDELLEWDRWTRPARSFIEQSGKDIEIGPVVSQYLARVREFNLWFADHQAVFHAAEYAFLNAKLAEIARVRAPFVFERLREDIARVEAGTLSAADALSPWMGQDDRQLLEQLLAASVPSWVGSALHVLAERYGALPEDIVTRFRNAVRR
jgi:hypothetical protein